MITAESIRAWLKEQGKDRAWLAAMCNVSKATVNGWLSADRSIAKPSLRIIEQLMNAGITILPSLDLVTWKKLAEKAARRRITVEALIEEILRKEAQS
jgi:hypothetical protein